MELDNKTSYLLMFAALLLVRSKKASPAVAFRAMPLSGRSQRLAELIAKGRWNPSAARPVQSKLTAQPQPKVVSANRLLARRREYLLLPRYAGQPFSAPGIAA